MTEIPGKWADLLIKAGFTDRRYGTASLRRLGESAGVNVSTVSRLVIKGMGLTDANMQKIAEALKVPVAELHELATGAKAEPFIPPKGTEKLSAREKEAIAEIIRALVNAKDQNNDNPHEKNHQSAEPDQEKTQGHYDLVARKRVIKPHSSDKDAGQ